MLTPWNPFNDLFRIDSALEPRRTTRGRAFEPAVDVIENDDAYVLNAEVPGMDPEDIDIRLDANVLTLSGERSWNDETSRDGYQRVERAFGRFERSFVLPDTVNTDDIDASVENGLLRVTLPKEAKTLPRRIEVKASKLADKAKKLFTKGESAGSTATA